MMMTMMTMMAGCIRRNDRNKQYGNSNCGQEDITNTHSRAPLPSTHLSEWSGMLRSITFMNSVFDLKFRSPRQMFRA